VSDQPTNPFSQQPPPDPDKVFVQPFNHQPVSARVPEKVARGVFTTGQLILDSPKEFVIDFLQGLTRPHQVAARVVMTPATMAEFVNALRQNLDNYVKQFGQPPPVPQPPQERRPSIQEIYEHYKLPDELMGGTYANSVLIGHSPTEFFFDFIAGFYPTPAVAARVFLPAPQAPRFLNMITTSLQQYQARYAGGPQQQPTQSQTPPPAPPTPPATTD
jgi:hypothetical protein